MRRPFRVPFTLAAAVSLALFVATAGPWAWSYGGIRHAAEVNPATPPGDGVARRGQRVLRVEGPVVGQGTGRRAERLHRRLAAQSLGRPPARRVSGTDSSPGSSGPATP